MYIYIYAYIHTYVCMYMSVQGSMSSKLVCPGGESEIVRAWRQRGKYDGVGRRGSVVSGMVCVKGWQWE